MDKSMTELGSVTCHMGSHSTRRSTREERMVETYKKHGFSEWGKVDGSDIDGHVCK